MPFQAFLLFRRGAENKGIIMLRITVASYRKSKIPERYYSVREAGRSCLVCIYYTAACDLRKDKRYIVPLEHGECRLKKHPAVCRSFSRIPELRGRNMTILEKLYARHYTKKFLRRVVCDYFNDANAVYIPRRFFKEDYANMIRNYITKRRNKSWKN